MNKTTADNGNLTMDKTLHLCFLEKQSRPINEKPSPADDAKTTHPSLKGKLNQRQLG